MTRIAKKEVYAALDKAASNIIAAGGSDGRVSRADVTAKLKKVDSPEEKKLTDLFFRFVDHRDFKSGAQVTPANVRKAVEYAREHMVANYDLNNNGLSAPEVARMSLTGRAAVNLAQALKEAGAAAQDGGDRLSGEKLGKAIAPFTSKATYTSEGDYNPEFFNVKLDAGAALTGENVMKALSAPLKKLWDGYEGSFPADYTFEAYGVKGSKDFVAGLSETGADDDDYSVKSAAAFGKITDLMKANLTEMKVFKIGPRDEDNSKKLAVDQGLYAQVVVGRTADGRLAGIILGDVET